MIKLLTHREQEIVLQELKNGLLRQRDSHLIYFAKHQEDDHEQASRLVY